MWTTIITRVRARRIVSALPFALGLLVAVAACDSITETDSPLAPELSFDQIPGIDGDLYTRVEVPLGDGEGQTVAGVFGRRGGVLRLGNHYLIVPHGVVRRKARFTMTLSGDGHLDFDLHAVPNTTHGKKKQGRGEGAVKFHGPVYLVVDYSEATNLEDVDPRRLQVLYEPDDGSEAEPVRTQVARRAQLAFGRLEHFSRYCLAYN